MAQYAVLIYAEDSAHTTDTDGTTAQRDTAAHDHHAKVLEESGALVTAWALTPRDLATSIRADGVTDGPFVDSKEVVAGFYILEAPDLDAALAIARTNPAVLQGGGVEVRPVDGGMIADRTGA